MVMQVLLQYSEYSEPTRIEIPRSGRDRESLFLSNKPIWDASKRKVCTINISLT